VLCWPIDNYETAYNMRRVGVIRVYKDNIWRGRSQEKSFLGGGKLIFDAERGILKGMDTN